MLHISLTGEAIAGIGPFPITNSLLTTWFVMATMTLLVLFVKSSIRTHPTKIQLAGEVIVESLYDLFEGVLHEKVKTFFPLLASFFLFIIISNWIGLLPGIGSIGIVEKETLHEQVAPDQMQEEEKLIPFLRAPTADLNTTLGLALISFITLQYYGLKTLGATYLKKFINISSPINFYVGLLEIISEFGKIVSFGFRLFGNIFAGEVLLTVIAFLVPILAPIPFIGLELFVGLIQALVFSMLTAVFLSTAVTVEEH